jgi:MFS family permease
VLVRFPRPTASETAPARASIWREAAYGWQYIVERPGLLALLVLFALINFNVGIVTVLTVPMVLAFTTPVVLGSILSTAGVGLLIGSVLMSVWGGPRRRVNTIFGSYLVVVCSLMLVGLHPTIPIFYVSAFFFFMSVPFVGGASQAIWQVKVPPEIQGRVFAMRRVIAWSSLPLAYLAAGPLADRVFGPLLLENGALAGSVGRLIGVGPGYGIAFLFFTLGLLILAVLVASYFYPRLRLVEDELPDAIADAEPQVEAAPSAEPQTSGAAASA